MKRKFITVIVALLILSACVMLGGCTSSSDNPYESSDPDTGYEIADMSVTVDASAGDRSMRITEEYIFRFFESSHGFYRDIPVNSGEKIRGIKVSDISSFGNGFKVLHEDSDIVRIRVGKESEYVPLNRDLHATIEYTLITPAHSDYPDALVINVIGQGWSCNINHADVRVILPAETDRTPMYYYGGWGETNDAVAAGVVDVKPESGKREYSFSTARTLGSYQGLTVYYFMPEGALGSPSDNDVWYVFIGAVVLIGLALLLKFTVGHNAPLAPVTNFYPPKHPDATETDLPMDPVDMGYLIDNTCEGSDVTSLIFYFASKGYLNIIDSKSKNNKSENFKLEKVCDLPEGLPEYQYTFFNKLFTGNRKTVTVSELTNTTYTAVQSVQSKIKSKYNGKLYSGGAKAASVFVMILTVLFAFLSVFMLSKRMYSRYNYVAGLVALFPVVLTYLGMSYLVYNWNKLSKPKRMTLLIVFCVLAVVLSLILIPVTYRDLISTAEITIIALTTAAGSVMAPFIARRTRYYDRELTEILGFRDFLYTAEKDKLEMLLEENPQYYYDILPYANVLGVSDIWQNKFAGLTLQPPTYYSSSTVFDFLIFNSLYNRSYRAYSTATTSRPSSSSSSGGGRSFGGGGGGFSGGGFGGGGGGRW